VGLESCPLAGGGAYVLSKSLDGFPTQRLQPPEKSGPVRSAPPDASGRAGPKRASEDGSGGSKNSQDGKPHMFLCSSALLDASGWQINPMLCTGPSNSRQVCSRGSLAPLSQPKNGVATHGPLSGRAAEESRSGEGLL